MPARLHSLGIRDDPMCWNCNSETGDLAHLILYCKSVVPYWDKIFDFLSKMFQCDLKREFSTLAIGFLMVDTCTDTDRALLDVLLMSAVKMVLTNWKVMSKKSYKGWIN